MSHYARCSHHRRRRCRSRSHMYKRATERRNTIAHWHKICIYVCIMVYYAQAAECYCCFCCRCCWWLRLWWWCWLYVDFRNKWRRLWCWCWCWLQRAVMMATIVSGDNILVCMCMLLHEISIRARVFVRCIWLYCVMCFCVHICVISNAKILLSCCCCSCCTLCCTLYWILHYNITSNSLKTYSVQRGLMCANVKREFSDYIFKHHYFIYQSFFLDHRWVLMYTL